jgi:hypothetical protein
MPVHLHVRVSGYPRKHSVVHYGHLWMTTEEWTSHEYLRSTRVKCSCRHGSRKKRVLPRNAAAARPLAMCSTLFDTSLDVPYHAIVATHHNERRCLLEGHRQVLRAGDLVIGDRGYYSIDVCRSLHDSNVDVLLRVKEKASRKVSLSHRSIRTVLSHTMVLS